MAIRHIEEEMFENEIKSEDVVLVDFYADWCGPCKMLAPILEEISSERSSAKIVKINVDNAPGLSSKFGIMSIPTLIAFKDGKPIQKKVGLCSKEEIMDMINL